ncbi:methanogenesis marker 17 protein [Candidatus Methanoperedens nitratireducens]|uniref:Putative Methanogenesis marker protein 17 n=1 Tax=Candidatus Methanoperedens nitratireducens TaxID=1392998 RepID=A0A284VNB4_9EURY|nr:methanogenesis marker 17 protein [Candidatus Methanoperedens nitroreducens]SNQ60732.1 putative Methanogenesis marker protein 17 [Candidatus Methanoperedens nitroreducens]
MEQLETFNVESPDAVGAKTTKILIQDVLADLSLNRVIGRLKVFVDPVEPVFIFTALLRLGTPAIRLKDFAKIEMGSLGKDEIKIELQREAFTVKLLNKLWEKYGKESLEQPDKKIIIVKVDPVKEIDELRELVIEEPQQEVLDRLIDAIALRIIPEGFRVRKHELSTSYVLFVASEDTLKPEWIARAKDMLESMRSEKDA